MNATERTNAMLTKAVQIATAALMVIGFTGYVTLWMMGVV